VAEENKVTLPPIETYLDMTFDELDYQLLIVRVAKHNYNSNLDYNEIGSRETLLCVLLNRIKINKERKELAAALTEADSFLARCELDIAYILGKPHKPPMGKRKSKAAK